MAIKKSIQGFKRNSPDKAAKRLLIPSNQITMKGVDSYVHGIDNLGYEAIMKPGQDYTFPGSEVLETKLAKSGIHIKSENKGKFTAYKKRTGKTTEEALHSKDPHVRQMANFARNAKKWHHAQGGIELGQPQLTAINAPILGVPTTIPVPQASSVDWPKIDYPKPTMEVQPGDLPQDAQYELQGNYNKFHPENLYKAPEITDINQLPKPSNKMKNNGKYVIDGLLALDALIPGDSTHNQYVRPSVGINDRAQGTGSQAIAQMGASIGMSGSMYGRTSSGYSGKKQNSSPYIDYNPPQSRQMGGPLEQANVEVKRLAKAKGLMNAENMYVDHVPQYIDSMTGKPYVAPKVAPLPVKLPSGLKQNDIQTDGTKYWYEDPKTTDLIEVDPVVVRQFQGPKKMQKGGNVPYNPFIVLPEDGKKAKYVQPAGMGTHLHQPVLYEEGGTYDMSDNEIKDLLSKGYEIKIM